MIRRRKKLLSLALLGCMSAGSILRAEAPPTIWHALGLPQTFKHFRTAIPNKHGNHPCLEKKPPVKALADPANLESDVPAIKKAAEIKAQEDLAPQKIKAVKFLAKTGCGCYGGVAEALQAALEDCTEEVRYEAVLALTQALDSHCEVCNKTCCTKELAAKMYERAWERDETGCFIEPSERVREALREASAMCPPDMRDVTPPEGEKAIVVPDLPDDPGSDVLPPLPDDDVRRGAPQRGTPYHQVGSNRPAAFQPQIPLVPQVVTGEVIENKSKGFVRVQFSGGWRPPVGTQVDVYHQYLLGTDHGGTLKLVDYEGPVAVLSCPSWQNAKVSKGDTVECNVMVPASSDALASEPTPADLVEVQSSAPIVAPASELIAASASEPLVVPTRQVMTRLPVVRSSNEPQTGKPVVKSRKAGKARAEGEIKFIQQVSEQRAESPTQPQESEETLAPIVDAASRWQLRK